MSSTNQPSTIVDYTKADYHQKRHPEFLDNDLLCKAWSAFCDAAYFDGVIQSSKVLEVGGGLGNNLYSLVNRCSVTMTEPSELGREIAEARGIRTFPSLEDIRGETFDTILCRHVLEHVDNPLDMLLSMRASLRNNGELILVLPVENPAEFPGKKEDLNHHLFAWNPLLISNLLQRAGFTTSRLSFEFYTGRRMLLPIYRLFGARTYVYGLRFLGRMLGCREIVARSRTT